MEGPESVSESEIPIPEAAPGEALVKVAFVGICGTDTEFFTGGSYYLTHDMQSYPFVFGHEWSGVVTATGAGVQTIRPGDRVVGHPLIVCFGCRPCREGHINLCENREDLGIQGGDRPGAAADYVRVRADTLIRIPDELSLKHATLAEPTVTVTEGFRRVRAGIGDSLAVIGTGTLGLAAISIAKRSGVDSIDAIARSEEGKRRAIAMGANRAISLDQAAEDSYSVVIEASGASEAVRSVSSILAPGGRAAILGVAHHPVDQVDMAALTLKDCTFYGILHGVRRYDAVLGMLADGTIEAEKLIDSVIAPAEIEAAFERAVRRETRTGPKTLIEFGGEA
jgi:L-iditol 2-dehydrogenase